MDIKRSPKRILSGIQPTGTPHLGNYLGALQHWVRLQSTPGQESLYMIADLHSLTVPQNPRLLKEQVQSLATVLLAMGLDPHQSILFRQSRVPHHTELAWILFCQTPLSWLKRMHHWRSKLQQQQQQQQQSMGSENLGMEEEEEEEDEGLQVGLLSYPVLQAADILLYRASQVPVGEDQAQHLNLANMIAKSFNSRCKSNVFPLPKSLFGKVIL